MEKFWVKMSMLICSFLMYERETIIENGAAFHRSRLSFPRGNIELPISETQKDRNRKQKQTAAAFSSQNCTIPTAFTSYKRGSSISYIIVIHVAQ